VNRIRINIIVKLFFFAVILCFVGHEVIPHHHHDFLSIRSNSCHGHDHNDDDDSSCKILNHLSSDNKSISCTIKFDVIKKLVPRDLITSSTNQILKNTHPKDLKVFENKHFRDDDQFTFTSRLLRAPPAA